MNANDIELALRARAAFNDSVEQIDADTRRRLRDIRQHTLRIEPRHRSARWIWPTGAALTAAFALAVFLPRLPQTPTAMPPATPAVVVAKQDSAPAATARVDPNTVAQTRNPDGAESPSLETADPDMLSDLDFYGWLAKQPGTGNTGG